jgi:hypothetical protein
MSHVEHIGIPSRRALPGNHVAALFLICILSLSLSKYRWYVIEFYGGSLRMLLLFTDMDAIS